MRDDSANAWKRKGRERVRDEERHFKYSVTHPIGQEQREREREKIYKKPNLMSLLKYLGVSVYWE